jgi:hypothetical protein
LVIAVACGRRSRAIRTNARDRRGEAGWSFLDEHAPAFALVLAAATAGIGIGYGTYSASSSDASGYVSEAALIASARLSSDEPLARAVAWRNATWDLLAPWYRPGVDPGELVPTYPAGLPLVMTPFRVLGGELATYIVVPLLGAIAVLATYYAGVASIRDTRDSPPRAHRDQSDSAVSHRPTDERCARYRLVGAAPAVLLATRADCTACRWRRRRPCDSDASQPAPLAIVIALATMNFPRMRLSVAQSSSQVRCTVERGCAPTASLGFAAGITPAIAALLADAVAFVRNPLASGTGGERSVLVAQHRTQPGRLSRRLS